MTEYEDRQSGHYKYNRSRGRRRFQQPSNCTFFDPAGEFTCDLCNLVCTGIQPYRQHLKSGRHLKNAASQGFTKSENSINSVDAQDDDPPTLQASAPKAKANTSALLNRPGLLPLPDLNRQAYTCHTCRIACETPAQLEEHCNGKRHIKAQHQEQIFGAHSVDHPLSSVSCFETDYFQSAYLEITHKAREAIQLESTFILLQGTQQPKPNDATRSGDLPVISQEKSTSSTCESNSSVDPPVSSCPHVDCVLLRALTVYSSRLKEQLKQLSSDARSATKADGSPGEKTS